MASSDQALSSTLSKIYGAKKGQVLHQKYQQLFSKEYFDVHPLEMIVVDIQQIEQLSEATPLLLHLYYTSKQADEHPLHLRIYQLQKSVALSDILPMLENFDLKTYNQLWYEIKLSSNQFVSINDFAISYKEPIDLEHISPLFQEAFTQIYFGSSENDGFNKLILGALLSSREIMLLRAYTKYLQQTRFQFSQAYIEKTLASHPVCARDLIEFFLAYHRPDLHKNEKKQAGLIEYRILKSLETVKSLDEDRIIRRLLILIKATLRTNFFQKTKNGEYKEYLSLKLNSKEIPDLPQPIPLYEIFVYASRFEAIHLRNAKVSRGGIRFSDRPEDFRTEILGLMKAQKVKNAIIVPSGAKGGFVLKNIERLSTRDALKEEVVHCYKSFIRGLLDLTDNIKENKFIRPKEVTCYDDTDPYLVVAADKGTATFSDIANELAAEYDFWLGDAFASGGKTGYDHKKIGITARGAWESIKRHFRELDIDVTESSITVIGIGDMSGDVFGNGMLYSTHMKLVAAFDHRHIFLDPDPNSEHSFQERKRLFNLPGSAWSDYNLKLISKGGGVFSRSEKSIPLSKQVKKMLDIEEPTLTPHELIRAILKAPVDLLFNGGIGTYVKASSESHTDVSDRTNDYCRINGEELRCKVVGEGGNLGFTQLGRIEYALNGGLINTDFIDNSGGVDCSDHEVNLKILLNEEVAKNRLSLKERDRLLSQLTQEVADLVLKDNHDQALVMSFSAFHAKKNITLHQSYLSELESQGILKRKVEFLPSDKKIIERKASELGLTRPELAILLAYTKIYVKQGILKSNLFEDIYLKNVLDTAFPYSIRKKYKKIMHHHRLYKDIIATQLSNHIVNEMGITFVYRLQVETGSTIEEIARAHAVASHIFGTKELQKTIVSLDFKISYHEQCEMLYNIRSLINLSTRWFLRRKRLHEDLQKTIDEFSLLINQLEGIIPDLMGGMTKQYLSSLTEKFIQSGLSESTAKRIASYRAIYTSLNIIEVATTHHFDLIKTAKVYFAAGEQVNLLWFRDQLANDSREGHWNALARLTLRDELDFTQRALTISIMKNGRKEESPEELIEHWLSSHKREFSRWSKILEMLHGSSNIDYSMFFIAVRELLSLLLKEQPALYP